MRIPDYLNGVELFEIDIYEEEMKQDDTCMHCQGVAIVTYDNKYHGYRGSCPDCKTLAPKLKGREVVK